MAIPELRREENVPGDFYVDSSCIDCDLCRQIAPDTFSSAGDQSAVHSQPDGPDEEFRALQALVACPTASIGSTARTSARLAAASFPEPVEDNVHFCGYAAESSFGASSYLVTRPEGNLLIDSPRFARPLVKRIEEMGGVSLMFFTHRDDVADHRKWAAHFGAPRIIHEGDAVGGLASFERIVTGRNETRLDADLLMIPTPGHTRGHMVLLYGDRFLFTGDHMWWSPAYKSLHSSPSVCWYSWPRQIDSVRRLLDYRFSWVLPGHGRRFFGDEEDIREQIRANVERMRRVRLRTAG